MKKLFLPLLLCLLSLPVSAQEIQEWLDFIDTMAITEANIEVLDAEGWRVYYSRQFEEFLPVAKRMWERGESDFSNTKDSLSYYLLSLGKKGYAQSLTLLGQYHEGIPLMEEALSDMENYFGPIKRIGYSYVGLGIAYSQFGDPYRALWAQNQAARVVRLHVKPGDSDYHLVGNAYNNLAHVYAELKQPDKAIELLENAEKVYRVANAYAGVLGTFYKRGRIAALSGNIPLAKVYMKQARKYQKELGLTKTRLFIEATDAFIELEAGNVQEALAYYEEAEKMTEEVLLNKEYFPGLIANAVVEFYLKYVETLMLVGNVAKAKEMLVRGKEIHQKTTRDLNNIEGLNYRLMEARVAAAENDMALAAAHLEHTIEILTGQKEVDWLRPEPEIALRVPSPLLAKAYRISAEIQAAAGAFSTNPILENCEVGKAILRKIQLSYAPDVTMDRLLKENRSLYDLSIAKAYAEAAATGSKESIASYFTNIEEARDQQLLATVDTRQEVAYGLPDDLLRAETTARQRLRAYERLLHNEQGKEKKNTALIFDYQSHLRSSRLQIDSIADVIRSSFPEYYELKFREDKVTLRDVQKVLTAGEAMFCYYVANDEVYGLMITSEEAVPFKSELPEERIQAFNETLIKPTDKPSATWQQQSLALYEQLLFPLRDRSIDRVIVVPDKSLSFLAWPALLTEAGKEGTGWRTLPYLVHSVSLRQESSAGVYLRQQAARGGRLDYSYAGIAPAYSGERYSMGRDSGRGNYDLLFPEYARQEPGALVYNGDEVRYATSLFNDPIAEVGEGATEQFFKTVAGNASILHVASHGITSARDPAASHLVLSNPAEGDTEDGLLHAWEIYGMKIPADLTVLSACQTGRGALRSGTGVLSLARAFRYAGSKDVVMSLWSVNDRSTYQVMRTFFTGVKDEQDKASALQGAMIDHLSTEKGEEFTHPYYWAGFSLVGPGDVLDTGGRSVVWVCGVAVGLFFLVVFGLRRLR